MNNIIGNEINEKSSIGKDVAKLRVSLDMSQTEFANAISVSRMTIYNIEKEKTNISHDLAFRLYYVSDKLIKNIYMDSYIRESSKALQERIEKEIILNKNSGHKLNPISYQQYK